jgi:hypothetical protein
MRKRSSGVNETRSSNSALSSVSMGAQPPYTVSGTPCASDAVALTERSPVRRVLPAQFALASVPLYFGYYRQPFWCS